MCLFVEIHKLVHLYVLYVKSVRELKILNAFARDMKEEKN